MCVSKAIDILDTNVLFVLVGPCRARLSLDIGADEAYDEVTMNDDYPQVGQRIQHKDGDICEIIEIDTNGRVRYKVLQSIGDGIFFDGDLKWSCDISKNESWADCRSWELLLGQDKPE